MSAPAARTPRTEPWYQRFMPVLLLLATMWAVRFFDAILPGSWVMFGIRSWDPSSAPGLVLSPLLHSGWPHLLSNTGPFLVLGLIVAAEGARRFWLVTMFAALIGGAGTWVVGVPGTLTVGASGLVFGYFGYIMLRALFFRATAHRVLYAVVALVVAFSYGSGFFLGLLPVTPGISWQGHLFGMIGGAVAAWTLSNRDEGRRVTR